VATDLLPARTPARRHPPAELAPTAAARHVKIIIAGGFGVGKTTLIGSISEIDPVTTEHRLTAAGVGHDDLSLVPAKMATTVAMDFGRITLEPELILYLFGTPGQQRFWFMWDQLALGAIGAVVLVDTRRLVSAFGPVDYFERHRVPFAIAINPFDNVVAHRPDDVREALTLGADVPIVVCDARDRISVRDTLIAVVAHALHRQDPRAVAGSAGSSPLTPGA